MTPEKNCENSRKSLKKANMSYWELNLAPTDHNERKIIQPRDKREKAGKPSNLHFPGIAKTSLRVKSEATHPSLPQTPPATTDLKTAEDRINLLFPQSHDVAIPETQFKV